MPTRQKLLLALIVCLVPNSIFAQIDSNGFQKIFDGKTLNGWSGDSKYWSVEDGAITGVTDGTLKMNHFITWENSTIGNFEIRVKVKVTAGGNSGIQYRGILRPDLGSDIVSGYQCDVVANIPKYNGMLYEERGRKILSHTGEKVIIDPQAQPWVIEKLPVKEFASDQWHEYRVLVKGNHHQHWINGHKTADLIDFDEAGRNLKGVLAMQVHVGSAMKIQFKDFYLKRLPDSLPLLKFKDYPIPATAYGVRPQKKLPKDWQAPIYGKRKNPGQQDKKPNILFIAIDDLNDWTGMLKGNPQAKTPHMDKLASKGMIFTNAHCAAPACGPSRSAIMSGILPSTSGNYVNKNSITRNPILNNSVLLPEFFQQNGYYVAGSGKLFHGAHFNEEVQGRGFDDYAPSKTQDQFPWIDRFSSPRPLKGFKKGLPFYHDWGPYAPDVKLEDINDGKTAIWAQEQLLSGELKEPFFIGAGIFQPHLPNYALQEYFDKFPLDEIALPEGYLENDLEDVPEASSKQAHIAGAKAIRDAGQWKPAIRAYLASTAMTDDLIGRIVGALEKSKYADNTIIVLWSDHGFQLGEKERWEKFSLWERATRVNMIWVAPGVTKPGTTSAKPVNLLDIYPTLASLTGTTPPEKQLEGNDLSVLMKNPAASGFETTLITFGFKNYAVRSERYRYIVYADGSEEFYDHQNDKWEWKNLANDPIYADRKIKMRKKIPTYHEPIGAIQEKFERRGTPSKK